MSFEANSFSTNSFSIGSWLLEAVESGYRLVSAVASLLFKRDTKAIDQAAGGLTINQVDETVRKKWKS